MNQPTTKDEINGRKPWTAPEIHAIDLTPDEQEALRASDNPMELLRTMKPELWERSAG